MSFAGNQNFTAGALEAQGTCTVPLDLAIEYIRARLDRVLPIYVIAMAPHAVVSVWLIDAICGERRSQLPTYCWYLVACTAWRWVWLTRLQYDVQREVAGKSSAPFWRSLHQVLLLRLVSHIAISWGSFLALIPAFYGFYIGSFAAPLVYETRSDLPQAGRLRQLFSWIHSSTKRLFRIALTMSVMLLTILVAALVSEFILAQTVLPSLLGLDTTDVSITLDSWSWRLRLFYFVFLIFDAMWAVASVFVYYDSQSRRMATDLRARMQTVVDLQTS